MSAPALHCQRIGTGPDLVLLHGWGMHSGIWAPLIELLAPHVCLHLYDLPGHGHSALADEFSLDRVCAQLADELPQQAYCLGWSLGGVLALEFAARYPTRVARLILLASNPRFVATDAALAGIAPDVLEGFAHALEEDPAATLKRFLTLVARGAADGSVLRALRESMRAAPVPAAAALRGGLSILRNTDLRARLDLLQMPVLWLAGERDTLVPLTALQQLAREYPSMSLVSIGRAGHAPFISHPQAVAAAVLEFLQ